MVGTARFELATPCTPSKCATRLRYVPIILPNDEIRCPGFMMTAWGLTFKFYTSRQPPAMLGSDPQPDRLQKNSDSRGFWEGHDFSRAVKSFRFARALAPEVCFLRPRILFPQPAKPRRLWGNLVKPV